jgi:hypothetical protein
MKGMVHVAPFAKFMSFSQIEDFPMYKPAITLHLAWGFPSQPCLMTPLVLTNIVINVQDFIHVP